MRRIEMVATNKQLVAMDIACCEGIDIAILMKVLV